MNKEVIEQEIEKVRKEIDEKIEELQAKLLPETNRIYLDLYFRDYKDPCFSFNGDYGLKTKTVCIVDTINCSTCDKETFFIPEQTVSTFFDKVGKGSYISTDCLFMCKSKFVEKFLCNDDTVESFRKALTAIGFKPRNLYLTIPDKPSLDKIGNKNKKYKGQFCDYFYRKLGDAKFKKRSLSGLTFDTVDSDDLIGLAIQIHFEEY
jgi:hypothetical protein